MMPVRTVLLSLCFLVAAVSARGQWYLEPAPLHYFLQKHFDSSLVYYSSSSWRAEPNYRIIARSKGKDYLFTYTNPYRKLSGRHAQDSLLLFFIEQQVKFATTRPDTNRYFLPYYAADYKQPYWNRLSELELWKMEPEKKQHRTCEVNDDIEEVFYLITPGQIKTLSYYAPQFYETCAPPDPNRKRALQLIAYLKSVFAPTN